MHDEAETQGSVEAIAEHDSHDMRLSGMFRAFRCSPVFFLSILQHPLSLPLYLPLYPITLP